MSDGTPPLDNVEFMDEPLSSKGSKDEGDDDNHNNSHSHNNGATTVETIQDNVSVASGSSQESDDNVGDGSTTNSNIDKGSSSADSIHSSSHRSSSHGASSSRNSSRKSRRAAQNADQEFAERESRQVNQARACMVVFFVSITGLLAQGVYFFVRFGEIDAFHDGYDDQKDLVLEQIGGTIQNTLAAIDNFMDAVEAEHEAAVADPNITDELEWPRVRIHDFAVRGSKVLELSRGALMQICPAVEAGTERIEWEEWAAQNHIPWIEETVNIQQTNPGYTGEKVSIPPPPNTTSLLQAVFGFTSPWIQHPYISNDEGPLSPGAEGPHFPTYQSTPFIPPEQGDQAYGYDNFDPNAIGRDAIKEMKTNYVAALGLTQHLLQVDEQIDYPTGSAEHQQEESIEYFQKIIGDDLDASEPLVTLYYPIINNANRYVNVYEEIQRRRSVGLEVETYFEIVGTITVSIFWRDLLRDNLPPGANGMVAVIGNDCGQQFTYKFYGPNVEYVGAGDFHESEYAENKDLNYFTYVHDLIKTDINDRGTNETRAYIENKEVYTGFRLSEEYCPYSIHLYGSDEMRDDYETLEPFVFLLLTVTLFICAFCSFKAYDWVSERRTQKILRVAAQSTAVVSSLFPKVVRDKLFPVMTAEAERKKKKESAPAMNAKMRLKSFMGESATPRRGGSQRSGSGGDDDDDKSSTMDEQERQQEAAAMEVDVNAPIAELFPETTVLFADIAGFTAWSSVREPAQVFTLLETLYGAFDKVARRRGVFKVETIGDSYMAVTGLPEPRKDHALVMSKFARDIRDKMEDLTKKLSRTLGPDTDDLQLRIGMNSGPVTAGVLRGDKSRFQLFGDTVNTASRMESTGIISKIQCSVSTMELLQEAGKSHWCRKRDGGVQAKGKGIVETYWVEPSGHSSGSAASVASSTSGLDDDNFEELDEKTLRLVEWNVDIMKKLIQQVVARRESRETLARKPSGKKNVAPPGSTLNSPPTSPSKAGNQIPLDEVQEVVELPDFDSRLTHDAVDPSAIELSDEVMIQLKEFISIVAVMYRNNPFHNFEHASHVTMSVVKLLSRIVAPSDHAIEQAQDGSVGLAVSLHDHTYGITSDPLTQFACVFSALIHDVDHQGVPNTQLIAEESPLDGIYRGKSLAEQNSVDLSWKLLMEDQFEALRNIICATPAERVHFRHLVVNCVLATDIMDKDLKTLRNARWEKAFSEQSRLGESAQVNTNRKATIVIEHLIQASDVAHTMQHWHVYRKWNERLFEELYVAFKNGRSTTNPADFWYKGEMGFFDFYIIPLAKKLSDCGVFGVASDEYLNYAQRNREEWERRGQELVAQMLDKLVEDEEEGKNPKAISGQQMPGMGPPMTISAPAVAGESREGASPTEMTTSNNDDDGFDDNADF